MIRGFVVAAGLAAQLALAGGGRLAAQPAPAAATPAETRVTPALVREMQFMLTRIGIDPGPIDGVPRNLTNRALHQFETSRQLPEASLEIGRSVPTPIIAALREAASRAVFGAQPAPPAAPPPAAVVPPTPPKPPPDRFAACHYDPADFQIGGHSYTPDSFLAEGFSGSTKDAVDSLKARLTEARQIADRVGPAAMKEVDRQSRVLAYFECRLKIEQAGGAK